MLSNQEVVVESKEGILRNAISPAQALPLNQIPHRLWGSPFGLDFIELLD